MPDDEADFIKVIDGLFEDHPFSQDPLRAALISLSLCHRLRTHFDQEESCLLDRCTNYWLFGGSEDERIIILEDLYNRLNNIQSGVLHARESKTRLLISSLTVIGPLDEEACSYLIYWAEISGVFRSEIRESFETYLRVR